MGDDAATFPAECQSTQTILLPHSLQGLILHILKYLFNYQDLYNLTKHTSKHSFSHFLDVAEEVHIHEEITDVAVYLLFFIIQ